MGLPGTTVAMVLRSTLKSLNGFTIEVPVSQTSSSKSERNQTFTLA